MRHLLLVALLLLPCFPVHAGDVGALVLSDDMSLAGHSFGNALASENFASATGTWSTPELDTMAAEGVILSNLYSSPNCAPSRAALLTGANSGRDANPFGDIYRDINPITIDAEFSPYVETIVDRAHAQGLKIAWFGKPHVNRDWDLGSPSESWKDAMGFDHAEKILWEITDTRNYQGSGDSFDNSADCYGHNLWVSDNENLETEYVNDVIFDAAESFITTTAKPDASDWLVIIATYAPHGPTTCGTDGIGADSCSGATVCDGGLARDDRPTGCTATNDRDVVGCHLQEASRRVGTLSAILSLDPATGTDWLAYTSDNGSAERGASDDCLIDGATKLKGFVYPCGTRVGGIFRGAGITATGSLMEGLYGFADLSATLLGLMGYSGSHHPDSRSFASCLRSATPSNCWEREAIVAQRWRPLGGITDGSIRGQPRTDGPADEYFFYQVGVYTRVNGVLRFLARLVDESVAPSGGEFTFCEEVYDLVAGDLYADTPEFETCTGSQGRVTGLTGDQGTALDIAHRYADGVWSNEGLLVPAVSGGTR